MNDYFLCGWRVGSDFPLPMLSPWTGVKRVWDMTIQKNSLPFTFKHPITVSPTLQVTKDGAALYSIADIATYLVTGGSDVVISTALAADDSRIAHYLLGPILALMCLRRGLLPLQATCVTIGQRTMAFAGPSGSGAFTLATALAQRGHRIVAQDLSVIDAHAAGGPHILPIVPAEGERPRLDTLILLPTDHIAPTLPRGLEHAETLSNLVHEARAADAWGLKAQIYKTCEAVAAQTRIESMARPLDPGRLGETLSEIEALAAR